MRRLAVAAAGACALAAFLAGSAGAQDTKALTLELNTLTQVDTACRVTFLARNQMGVEIGDVGVEVVLFDKEGRVSSILVLKTGRLTAGKTRVKQFPLPNVACDNVSSILVNDVTECSGEGLSAPTCLDALQVSSKAGISLDL